MEAVGALGLASAVVQLTHFGWRVFSATTDRHRSTAGLADELVDIETASSDLNALVKQFHALGASQGIALSPADKSLAALAKTCAELSGDLLKAINTIKRADTGKRRTWHTIGQAFRAVLKEDEIRALQRRLEPLKSELMLHLIHFGRDERSGLHRALADHVRASQESQINNTKELEHVKSVLKDQAAKRSAELEDLRSDLHAKLGHHQQACEAARDECDSKAKAILDAVLANLQVAQKACYEASLCQDVIASLHYPELPLRHTQIPETYKSTFAWILRHAPFRPWLECSGGGFWINGKAGSGKSTLMKFLSDAPETRHVLRKWAGDRPLIQASFYFWSSGWPMQRSREGLLRSLLCQILRQCPVLIPKVCPQNFGTDSPQRAWSYSDLIRALNAVVATKEVASRFCFFIDGLDEYDGDQYDLVQVLSGLSTSSAVKVCVSSRPWNVFRKAYDDRPGRSIVLQDLTRSDIDSYIEGSLQQDARFTALAATEDQASVLLEEIRTKAQGVFLWVFLVVRSLLRGLTEDDDLETLMERLRDFPDTLEEYFKKMLHSIEKFYQQYTARSLLIALVAETPLPLLSYSYLQIETKDPGYALRFKYESVSDREFSRKQRTAATNVNKWCRDLLEVLSNCDDTPRRSIFARQVTFMHRTVRDFLLGKDVDSMLWQFAGSDFEPELALARTWLHHAKTIDRQSPRQVDALDIVAARLMHNAKLYEQRYNSCCADVILELETVGNSIRPPTPLFHWTDISARNSQHKAVGAPEQEWSIFDTALGKAGQEDGADRHAQRRHPQELTRKSIRLHRKRNLLAYAVEFDLLIFVEHWLKAHPSDVSRREGAPLLYHALSPVIPIQLLGIQGVNYQCMVELLLRAGADPNESIASWNGGTVWERIVTSISPWDSDPDNRDFGREYDEIDSSINRDYMTKDDQHIRQLFSFTSEWPGDVADGPIQRHEETARLLELMLHHDADDTILRQPVFEPLLCLLCEKCRNLFRAKLYHGYVHPDRSRLVFHDPLLDSASTKADWTPVVVHDSYTDHYMYDAHLQSGDDSS